MGTAKIAIISDGEHTALYANGFLYGSGIERLEFSTEDRSGSSRATIRLLEVNAAGEYSQICGETAPGNGKLTVSAATATVSVKVRG